MAQAKTFDLDKAAAILYGLLYYILYQFSEFSSSFFIVKLLIFSNFFRKSLLYFVNNGYID